METRRWTLGLGALALILTGCAPLGSTRVLIMGSHNHVYIWLIVRQDSHPRDVELGETHVDKFTAPEDR
jgi:hypothetical protein